MWPNAEVMWIHFTQGVSSHQCHLYDTHSRTTKKKGLRNEWVNINDLITFLSIRSNSMFISIVINLTLLEVVCLSICMWNLTRRDLREIKVNMSYLVGNDLMNSVSLNSFWL